MDFFVKTVNIDIVEEDRLYLAKGIRVYILFEVK